MTKVIRISRAKFHCNKLPTIQDNIQDYVSLIFAERIGAILCISEACAVMRCLSVCVSVTFVDNVKTNKHIFKIFHYR